MTIFVKDPAAELAYAVDWDSTFLAGQTIVSSSWAVQPDGEGELVVLSPQIAGARTLATLAGGRMGCVYRVTNSILCSDGGRDERTLVVRVEDR